MSTPHITSTPPNVLFYSKNCVHCKKFSQLLLKLQDINAQFVKISVDVKNIRLPDYVTEVPTIVVFDDFKNKHVLQGTKAFEWLNQFLEDASKIEIIGYDVGIMSSSLSDGFCFLNENEETEHTFAFLDQLHNTGISVPLNDPTMGTSKVNSSELDRYQAERDRAVPTIKKVNGIDFQQGFNQSGPHKISNEDVLKFQNLRSKQIGRKPPPNKAPNFESVTFNAANSAQSKRGGYVPYGGAGGGSQKEQLLQSRLERLQTDRNNMDMRHGMKQPPLPKQLQGVSTNPRQQQNQRLTYDNRTMPRNSNFRTL